MKKTLIALAVLASSGAAMAQSTFTLYGIADANLERIKGSSSINRVSSGGLQGSRFGLKGSEDLGGGLKGVFQIENGFSIDTGNLGQGGRMFGRQAYVGLEGSFGSVRVGRQYTPSGDVADMVGTKGYDVLALTGTISGSTNIANSISTPDAYRADNAITYKTPSFSGFTAAGQYFTKLNGSEINSGASPKQGRGYSFNGVYAQGPIRAAIGYIALDDVNSAVADAQKRNELILVAGYDLGVANLTGYYANTEIGNAADKAASKMKVYGLSAAFPFGALTVTPGIGIAKDVNGSSAAAADDATLLTLQAKYDLSKRTALYAHLANVSNKAASSLGFADPAADSSSYGMQVGVRHAF